MSETLLKIIDGDEEEAKHKERGEIWVVDEDDVDMDDGVTLVAEDEKVANDEEKKETVAKEKVGLENF